MKMNEVGMRVTQTNVYTVRMEPMALRLKLLRTRHESWLQVRLFSIVACDAERVWGGGRVLANTLGGHLTFPHTCSGTDDRLRLSFLHVQLACT